MTGLNLVDGEAAAVVELSDRRHVFARMLCDREARRLGRANRAAFDLAKQQGYLVVPQRESEAAVRHVWWHWAEGHDWPYIVVELRRQYAAVSMDLVATSYRLSVHGVNAVREAILRYVGEESFFGFGETRVDYPTVPIGQADELAVEFLRIARLDRRPA